MFKFGDSWISSFTFTDVHSELWQQFPYTYFDIYQTIQFLLH